ANGSPAVPARAPDGRHGTAGLPLGAADGVRAAGTARRAGRAAARPDGPQGRGRIGVRTGARRGGRRRPLGVPVPSCRRIVVTSIRGGAGKSTVAALVAAIVQRHRDDRVVAIDAAPGLGSLPLRLDTPGRGSIRHLAAGRPGSWNELAGHLARTPAGLFVVPAGQGSVADELEHDTFQRGTGRLNRHFAAVIIDCGSGLDTELHRGILAGAHSQVFVAPATVDGALSARAALQWFGANGFEHVLSRTVVALVAHKPKTDMDLGRAGEELHSHGLPVAHVPFDRHLAASGAIVPDRIGASAHSAIVEVACAAFERSLDAA
ncbi:MinD/ParA family protein, partial [Actinomadura sp. CNU-125]|uniref:MinD/ParA family ATP-binding protein n=1 Tax=Actinomadura sp. CNU-125 TaxID=1904961 RepID=UPI000B179FB4